MSLHVGGAAGTVQRTCAACAAGGTPCAACADEQEDEKHTLQTKLRVGPPNDRFEIEADRVADQVMRMPAPRHPDEVAPAPFVSRAITPLAGTSGAEVGSPVPSPAVRSYVESLPGRGQPLPPSARDYFERRFGCGFDHVRIHTDAEAERSADALRARAYTVGPNVVFGSGEYRPHSPQGQRLLAHELTHVVQQGAVPRSTIQRDGNVCGDPDYCTPYPTPAAAASEEAWLRSYFLPIMNAKFGSEVRDLWESFLSRTPSSGLTPRVYDTPGDPIEDSFATSSATESDEDAVLDMVISRVTRFPGGRLRPHTYTVTALTNYLSASEMDNRPIDYSNPLSKAGNIAGGIGSSDAGPDYRKIVRANVSMEKVPLVGNSGYIDFTLTPHYEVFDAVDFCPGQCGSPAEQIFTIPLSRLEASGEAYDVPYFVRFQPEPVTNREFYSSFPI